MSPDYEELGGPGCQGAAVQVTLQQSVHSCLPGIEFELETLSRIWPQVVDNYVAKADTYIF